VIRLLQNIHTNVFNKLFLNTPPKTCSKKYKKWVILPTSARSYNKNPVYMLIPFGTNKKEYNTNPLVSKDIEDPTDILI
jgi:hypothetical protein